MTIGVSQASMAGALLAATLLLSAPGEALSSTTGPSPRPHNVHVTRGRMAIESSVAVARINFFRHDLEAALAAFHEIENFSLGETTSADSLFLSYFDDRFSLASSGTQLAPEILRSGEAKDVWWYELQFAGGEKIDTVTVRDELLFELYDDQKHFLKLSFFPEGETRDLYFVPGATTYEVARKE